jgi:hypothetical protein
LVENSKNFESSDNSEFFQAAKTASSPLKEKNNYLIAKYPAKTVMHLPSQMV